MAEQKEKSKAEKVAVNIIAGIILLACLTAVILIIVFIVHLFTNHSTSKPSTTPQSSKQQPTVKKAPKYYAGTNPDVPIEQAVQPLDAKTMQVEDQVINSGNGAGKPVCTIQLGDFSTPYHGTDIVTDPNELLPGKTWNFKDQITITNSGAEQASALKQVVTCN